MTDTKRLKQFQGGRETAINFTRKTFPIFTTAALVLLFLKLGDVASFGDISWLWIPFIWLFPLVVVAIIFTIMVVGFVSVCLVGSLFNRR